MKTYKKFNLILAGVLSLVLLFLYNIFAGGIMTCPSMSQLGVPCPTCGMTRDFTQILKGNTSNVVNPMSISFFIFFAIQVFYRWLIGLLPLKDYSQYLVVGDIVITIIWMGYLIARLLF